jgi:hypothetical protein
MSLILNEIHLLDGFKRTLMVAAADRRISNLADGSYNSSRRKMLPVPQLRGAVSYFGLADFQSKGKRVFLAEWLSSFIERSKTNNLTDFAFSLREELNRQVSGQELSTKPSGFHICGYDTSGIPDFWYLSNIGGISSDFRYTDLHATYSKPASHFLGRDASAFGYGSDLGGASRCGRSSYWNGDPRAHAFASEVLDGLLAKFWEFPDFRQPRTPNEYGEYVKFKFEVIAYVYKKWARRQIIARPIDVLVLQAN